MTFWMFMDRHAEGLAGLVVFLVLVYPGYKLTKKFMDGLL